MYWDRYIPNSTVRLLHASTDPDSVFLSSVITEPTYSWSAGKLLLQEGSLLGLLYASFIDWTIELPPGIDHPIADLMNAFTVEEYVRVARKNNDPLAWDRVLDNYDDQSKYAREAMMAGSTFGIMCVALSDDDIDANERRRLHNSAAQCEWNDHGKDRHRKLYCSERVLHAIGSSKCAYYLDQRTRASLAAYAWLVCAKRLRLYRDVALLIARLVFKSTDVYQRVPLRQSKRLKLKK